MNALGLPFVLIACLTVLAMRSPILKERRPLVLSVASLTFIASVETRIGDAACLLAMVVTGWIMMGLVTRYKSGRVLALAIASILGEFLVSRYALPDCPGLGWASIGRTIGLSYIMFRVIHLIVDAQGDELPPLRWYEYLCYLVSFLTFLAGPIQRGQAFQEQINRRVSTPLLQALALAIPDIIGGYFKFTTLAAIFFAGLNWAEAAPAAADGGFHHAIGWLSFAAYLYLGFSGYVDVVRGIGRLVDFDLPANFNRPFAAANFLDLWSRWHITLSEWFKFYVFNPAVKSMIASAQRPAWTPYIGALAYFTTFFLMGLWHGLNARFALYGLCLGGGVSVNKLYQVAMQQRLGRKGYAALARGALYREAARASAVGAFVLALGFLWIPPAALERRPLVWAEGGVLTLVAVCILTVGCPPVAVRLMAIRSMVPDAVFLGLQAVAILAYLFIAHGFAPPLVYAFF
jgi:alginate O-acetyltransferase complex protein AlgI